MTETPFLLSVRQSLVSAGNSAGVTGLILLAAALLGPAVASSPYSAAYDTMLAFIPVPALKLDLQEWISGGLMSLFFAGLAMEIRQDLTDGPLRDWRHAALPLIGAVGGMAVPALISALCGGLIPSSPGLKGWAIPTATDAAFTVPILALLPHVPKSLRSFLMALAIFDDLGAILILALFYGRTPDWSFLLLSGLVIAGMAALALRRTQTLRAYALPAVLLWWLLLRAGIEPSLAGVVFGLCLPEEARKRAARIIALPVRLIVLPLFAFSSTGVDLRLFSTGFLLSAPFLGSALGLFLGKPLGVFGAVRGATKAGWLPAPPGTDNALLIGTGMICGIGFTISLLVASLAFPDHLALTQARCGVLCGSALSAFFGWLILKNAGPGAVRTSSGCRN